MEVSFSAKRLRQSATLAINELITTLREQGEQILHLGFGESPFPVHQLVRNALCENSWRQKYLSTQGILPLREQVSEFYQEMFDLKYSAAQIIVGPGSKPLMFAALAALAGNLFLPAPSWVSYQHMGKYLDREIHHITTSLDESYRLTPEALLKALEEQSPISSEQKILVLNYPCNPTGHSFSAQQLKALARVAREHNVIVISDEIYALTHCRDQEHHSIAEYYPEGTIITGGLSKDRSLGGYRLGVLLLPQDEMDLLRSILAVGSEVWSSVSAPIQYAGIEAYRTDTELVGYIQDCAIIHELVTRHVHRRIQAGGISCPQPAGGFYLFPDWNKHKDVLRARGIETSRELANHLLKTRLVSSLPGSEFGMPSDHLSLRLATVDYDGQTAIESFTKDRDTALEDPDRFAISIAPNLVMASDRLIEFTTNL
ncbi:MAG: pyridoxal phosphate-dependent aminotransferase [Candidatus Hermodarchaeota archaeon]